MRDGYCECEKCCLPTIVQERDEARADAKKLAAAIDREKKIRADFGEVDDRLFRISAVFNAWANGDEPEGAPGRKRTLNAIGEILAEPYTCD